MAIPWWLPFGSVPEIEPDELAARIGAGRGFQLVDVRTRAEWLNGHIAGSINEPIHELPSRVAVLPLDARQPVVAICLSGHRSVPAVRLLLRHGYQDVRQLRGGMLAWRRRRLPETRAP